MASKQKKREPKIQSVADYFNPLNLGTVRTCNFIYKAAKEYYNNDKWTKAIVEYKKFLELNTADFDSLIEIATAYFKIKKLKKK